MRPRVTVATTSKAIVSLCVDGKFGDHQSRGQRCTRTDLAPHVFATLSIQRVDPVLRHLQSKMFSHSRLKSQVLKSQYGSATGLQDL